MIVTPFAGVWIEISGGKKERENAFVTPFAGVWIEIQKNLNDKRARRRHSLRGSVD